MSSVVRAAGLNASSDGPATAGSEGVDVLGGGLGWLIKTGWLASVFLNIGGSLNSALGVLLLDVEGMLSVEVDEAWWWWWELFGEVGSGPAVVLDSISPSYVGESIPSESDSRLDASWCRARLPEALDPLCSFELCLTGTDTKDAPSSVSGSLSSSDLQYRKLEQGNQMKMHANARIVRGRFCTARIFAKRSFAVKRPFVRRLRRRRRL